MTCKISWNPENLRTGIEHSDRIETFIEEYIIKQKQITPEPNPILLKLGVERGTYLTCDTQDISEFLSSFENIYLYGSSEDTNKFYTLDILGDYTEEGIYHKEINIGKITYIKEKADNEIVEILYFTPEKRENLYYRDLNATRTVQLIPNPKLRYSENIPDKNFFPDDVQIFNPADGSMLLRRK